jgi:hypothetical protein
MLKAGFLSEVREALIRDRDMLKQLSHLTERSVEECVEESIEFASAGTRELLEIGTDIG